MSRKNAMRSALPMAALDEIPRPRSDAKEIVGLVKQKGKITGYQLSDGKTVSKSEGVALAKSGEIRGRISQSSAGRRRGKQSEQPALGRAGPCPLTPFLFLFIS